jgi:hypothetical protein
MVKASSAHGGIWDDNVCNVHPDEYEAIFFWIIIYCFTEFDYEFTIAWRTWWAMNNGPGTRRRETFESVYGLVPGRRINPLTGQLADVMIVGNKEHFDWLCEWNSEGADCEGELYPVWP